MLNLYSIIAVCFVFALLSVLGSRIYVKHQLLKVEKTLSICPSELKQGTYHLDETLDGKLYQKLMDLYKNLEFEYQDVGSEMDAVKAYIADLSHQMKTPMANIKLYNELLLEDDLTRQEQVEFQEKIEFEVQKMEWMLGALTKIARLETKAVEFKKTEGDLAKTVKDAVAALDGQAMAKGITLNLFVTDSIALVHNKKWSQEALVNILENAIKYSEAGSKIDIVTEELELYTRVKIRDYGMGIPKSEYNQIFKRFYRGGNAQDKPGSGLGLYLAQLIMNKQDGYIVVDSKVLEGSCFSVYFRRELL